MGTVDLDCGQILFFSTIDGRLLFSIGTVNTNNPSGLNGIEVASVTDFRTIRTFNALGLPQEDRLTPLTINLGDYNAQDLVGNIVITQNRPIDPNSALNGTFTVAVSDIVAAGSSGYIYSGDIINPHTTVKISGDMLIIDRLARAGVAHDGNLNINSVTFQVLVPTNIIQDRLHASTHNQGGNDALTPDRPANIASTRTLGTGALQAASGTHTH